MPDPTPPQPTPPGHAAPGQGAASGPTGPIRPTPAATPADRRRDAVVAWLKTQQRAEPFSGVPVSGSVGRIRREIATTRRRLGRLIGPWETHVPEALAARCRVDGIRGDALMVTVDSPSTAWQLDRHLRAGLTRTLAQACGGGLRRVRVRVGRPEDFPGQAPDPRRQPPTGRRDSYRP